MKLNNFNIKGVNKNQVIKDIISFVRERKKVQIITLNTEMIMNSLNNEELKKIIKNSYIIPESSGILIASNYLSGSKWFYPISWGKIILSGFKAMLGLNSKGEIKNILPGIELCYLIAQISEEQGFKLLLLGGSEGIAQEAANQLKLKFPKLQVRGLYGGLVGEENRQILERVEKNPSDIILVAFGHGKQEKWIAGNLNKISASIGIGVGGSFDFIAGKVVRAPFILRKMGLEWLFRLILQPWRIKRQIALIKFLDYLARN